MQPSDDERALRDAVVQGRTTCSAARDVLHTGAGPSMLDSLVRYNPALVVFVYLCIALILAPLFMWLVHVLAPLLSLLAHAYMQLYPPEFH